MADYLSTKRIVYAGKGDLFDMNDGYKAFFHYRVETLPDDKQVDRVCIDDSKLPYPKGYGKQMELIFGKKFRLPVWEICLKSMRVDEVASFVLPVRELMDYPFVSKQLRDISKKNIMKDRSSDHDDSHCHLSSTCMGLAAAAGGLGYPELDAWLKKPTPLLFTFHLLSVLAPDQYERESWTLNANEKSDSAEVLRLEGNRLYASGKFAEACIKYGEALDRLDSLLFAEKPGEPEHVAIDERKVPLYSNIAECKLKLGEFYSAIEASDEALKRRSSDVKALFRRAKAHAGAWNFDEARRDFADVARSDASLRRVVDDELRRLDDAQQQREASDARRYKNLFAK